MVAFALVALSATAVEASEISGSFSKTSYADFNAAGAQMTNVEVTGNAGGEISLRSSFRDDFEGNSISAEKWTSGALQAGGQYVPSPSNGTLAISGKDGAYIEARSAYLNKPLEFRAYFAHVIETIGWATSHLPNSADDKVAWFRTLNNEQLYAAVSGEDFIHNLGSWWPNGYHVLKIVPTEESVKFFIDGTEMLSPDLPVNAEMKPVAWTGQDYVTSGGIPISGSQLLLDWINVVDYPNTVGEYISQSYDSGSGGTIWNSIDFSATEPSGTSIGAFVRTSADNIAWTGWQPARDGAPLVGVGGRYLQFKAALAGTSSSTPTLNDILVSYSAPEAPSSKADCKHGGWLGFIDLLFGNQGKCVASLKP